jgi:hypothetical protein
MDTARRSGGPWSVVGSNACQPRMAGCNGRSRVFLAVEGVVVSKVEGHVDFWRSREGRRHGKGQEGNGDRGAISETERGSESVDGRSTTRVPNQDPSHSPQSTKPPKRQRSPTPSGRENGGRGAAEEMCVGPVAGLESHFRSWRCRTSSGCCRRRGEREDCRFCWRSGDSAVDERATSRHGRLRSANHCPEVSSLPLAAGSAVPLLLAPGRPGSRTHNARVRLDQSCPQVGQHWLTSHTANGQPSPPQMYSLTGQRPLLQANRTCLLPL